MEQLTLKGIIFDMDGTLVDSERIYTEGYRRAFESKGITINLSEIESWSGQNSKATLDIIDQYTLNRELSKEIRLMRINYFHQALAKKEVYLHEGAMQLLQYCKATGLRIGLATSTPKDEATTILKQLEIYELFDFAVFGDEVPRFKPAPDIYELALKRGNLTPSTCLAVEDSKSGILAARNANLSVIQSIDGHVQTPYNHPEVLVQVNHLKEIETVINRLLS